MGLLLTLAIRHKTRSALAWAWVFGYILVDDALELHERVGAALAAIVSSPVPGLRTQDMGEALFVTAVGGVLGVVLLVAYIGDTPGGRRLARRLAAGLLALVFFWPAGRSDTYTPRCQRRGRIKSLLHRHYG